MTSKWKYILAAILIIILVAGANFWWYLRLVNKSTIQIMGPAYNMFSQVGEIDSVHYLIKGEGGKQGFLAYGPYLALKKGPYKLKFKLCLKNIDRHDKGEKDIGFIDVNLINAQSYNKRIDLKSSIFRRHNPAVLMIDYYIPDDKTQNEYRVFQYQGNELVLQSIEVSPVMPWRQVIAENRKIFRSVNMVVLFIIVITLGIGYAGPARLTRIGIKNIALLLLFAALEILLYQASLNTDLLSGNFSVFSYISSFDSDQAISNEKKEGYLVYGPYLPLKKGPYEVSFKILVDKFSQGNDTNQIFGYCDVFSNDSPVVRNSIDLPEQDFRTHNPREIKLRFKVENKLPKVEFRVFSYGVNSFSLTGLKLSSLGCNDVFIIGNIVMVIMGLAIYLLVRLKNIKYQFSKTVKLRIIAAVCILGILTGFGYHHLLGKVFGYPWPHNSFLYDAGVKYKDYYQTYEYSAAIAKGENPYLGKSPSVYFPFTFVLLYPLTLIAVKTSLIVFSIIVVLGFVWFLYQGTGKILYTMLLCAFSYPLLILLDRGNIEGFLFILLGFFIYLYERKKYLSSSIVLAMAICMKLYPAVLLVLLLSEKKYKETAICLSAALAISLGSFLMINGDLFASLRGIGQGMAMFKGLYFGDMHGTWDVAFNHTLFNMIKSVNILHPFIKDYNVFMRIYNYLALSLFALLSAYIVMIEKIRWRKLTLLIIAMILLPNISFDYTLINLYIPLMIFVGSEQDRYDFAAVITMLFALLILPKNYFVMEGKVSLGTFLNPILMIMIVAFIIWDGVKTHYREKERLVWQKE